MKPLKHIIKDLLRNTEDKAGLYITIIFHLVVIIALLAYQIDSALKREESFVLDFSKQEEIERLQKEEAFREDISKRLDDCLSAYLRPLTYPIGIKFIKKGGPVPEKAKVPT